MSNTTNVVSQLDPGIVEAGGVTAMTEAAFQAVLEAAFKTNSLEALDQVTLRSCQGTVFAPAVEFAFLREALRLAGVNLVVQSVAPARKRRPAAATPLTVQAAG